MYAKGMTTRDISAHLKSVYGVDASAEMISHMTVRILPIAKEWQNCPIEKNRYRRVKARRGHKNAIFSSGLFVISFTFL